MKRDRCDIKLSHIVHHVFSGWVVVEKRLNTARFYHFAILCDDPYIPTLTDQCCYQISQEIYAHAKYCRTLDNIAFHYCPTNDIHTISICVSESAVKTVAVCAGSGSSVLKDVRADLYVTGEMGHHDVLHATQTGTSVILCEHTNTERGYLKLLCGKLRQIFGLEMAVMQSKADIEPLVIT